MARLEVYLPGDGSITAEMSDEALAGLALGLVKNFREDGGCWVSVTSGDGSTPDHDRWIPASAGIALFWDTDRREMGQPPLSLVV